MYNTNIEALYFYLYFHGCQSTFLDIFSDEIAVFLTTDNTNYIVIALLYHSAVIYLYDNRKITRPQKNLKSQSSKSLLTSLISNM